MNINKKIIAIIAIVVIILLCVRFTTQEHSTIKYSDDKQTIIGERESGKLVDNMLRYKIFLNNEGFYVYITPEPKTKKEQKTLVILPGYTYYDYKDANKKYAPHKDFSNIINCLSDNYKVIVIEYYGYNESDDSERSRSADSICNEIHSVLTLFGIKKYTLMAHSISGLYAMKYINEYKSEVEGFIGVDITLPYYFLEGYKSNDSFLGYDFDPEKRETTKAYKNMYSYFWDTAKGLEGFKFPQTLPVILFASTSMKGYVDERIEKGLLKTKMENYLEDMVTDTQKQQIQILNGPRRLYTERHVTMANIIKENLGKNK